MLLSIYTIKRVQAKETERERHRAGVRAQESVRERATERERARQSDKHRDSQRGRERACARTHGRERDTETYGHEGKGNFVQHFVTAIHKT